MHSETMFGWPFIAQSINFVLLLWLLGKVARRPLLAALASRRDVIQSGVRESAALQEQAKLVHRQAEEGLRQMEAELRKLRQQIEQTARVEAERLMNEAQQRAQRTRREAEFVVAQRAAQMRRDLQRELSERTLALAEEMLRSGLTAEDHQRLGREVLAAVSLTAVQSPRRHPPAELQVSP